jgi:hypothetical protein
MTNHAPNHAQPDAGEAKPESKKGTGLPEPIRWAIRILILPFVAASIFFACGSQSKDFDSRGKVVRVYVNRKDEAGNPLVTDVEVLYTGCGGEVRTVIRSNVDFSKCALTKLKAGEEYPLVLTRAKKRDGHFGTTIVKLGECVRVPDPTDSRSYTTIRDCSELKTDGILVGTHCEVFPDPKVLALCPWFAEQ